MLSYEQDQVIDVINSYLKSKERPLTLNYGYCHGISLLWLYKMSQGEEQWFYDIIKKIIKHKDKEEFSDIEMDIEKFIGHIEWLQNSKEYIKDIRQMDIDKILELPERFPLSYVFNHRQFLATLGDVIENNKMVCLSGPTHTIGLFRREDKYHIFDPNYSTGRPKILTSVRLLKAEIIKCLFTRFKIQSHKLPVLFNIATTEDEYKYLDKVSLFKNLVESYDESKDVKGGITALFIACENRDETEVKILLQEKKVDPNKADIRGWTPMHIASVHNYTNIVKILLENGAKLNCNNCRGKSPLEFAIEDKYWRTVVYMLDTVKSVKDLSKTDLRLLRKYKKDIIAELKTCLDELPSLKENQFVKNVFRINLSPPSIYGTLHRQFKTRPHKKYPLKSTRELRGYSCR